VGRLSTELATQKASPEQAYVVIVAKIYIPIPFASHDQLAAAGCTAVIGINVDQ
jgi:hypothetical protein